jgi:hypothetical protein
MAGFYLEYNQKFASDPSDPVGLVDLGECDTEGFFAVGPVRAGWIYWKGSRQWQVITEPGRHLLIEGQPDRYPQSHEPLAQWLDGRSGSFRGFEILYDSDAPHRWPTVTVFVDPAATRAIFLTSRNGQVAVADKIADLVANTAERLNPDWAGLLENAVIGSLYSDDTTSLEGVELLKPGAVIGIHKGRIAWEKKTKMPGGLVDPEYVKREPVAALRNAFTTAVNETWNDPSGALLLSGGMDSRVTLTSARGRRRTVTLNFYPEETRIAAQVAACCGCDHLEIQLPESYFENTLNTSYLVTGGMHQVRSVAHLGLFGQFRRAGITGLCHGWPYNTFFRSWVARPYEKYPLISSPLEKWMGRKALYFQNYSCVHPDLLTYLAPLLSADALDMLGRQLRKLADNIETVIVGGMDLTFERRLLSNLVRQVYAGFAQSTLEGTDFYSPAFHPAIWSWYEASTPESRYNEWVYREMLIQSKHPAYEIPDNNTNRKIEHLPPRWQDRWRNQFWYPALRTLYLALRRQEPITDNPWPSRVAVSTLGRSLEVLCSNPLFNKDAIHAMFKRYEGGEGELRDRLWCLGSAGQWQEFVQGRTVPQMRQIREEKMLSRK